MNKSDLLEVGQIWYIKYHGACTVSEVRITDVSNCTVGLKGEDPFHKRLRYKRSDVDFIELKVK